MQSLSPHGSRDKLLLALTLFMALNGLLAWGLAVSNFDRFEACHHGRIYWALKKYQKLPAAPDVVLIGSSLLQRITYWGEADYLNQRVSALQHNRCTHLEDRLSKALGERVSSYAIAIGGMHASDASVVTTAMLAKKKPAMLVYLIAPRDLFDNFLVDPASTETFQLMSRLGDVSDVAMAARSSLTEKFAFAVESTLTRVLPFYNYRKELTTICERWWRTELQEIFQAKMFIARGRPLAASQLGLTIPEFDLDGNIGIMPHDVNASTKQENRLCYLFTYQPFWPKRYYNQLMFLRRMLNFEVQNGIKPVLVNMPLRSDNLTAMVPHFYDLYFKDVSCVARECGAEFIDMQDDKDKAVGFTDADFCDTVHLTGPGSIKFVDALADQLERSSLSQIRRFHKSNSVSQLAQTVANHKNCRNRCN